MVQANPLYTKTMQEVMMKNLLVRTFLGFIFLMVVMGLALFLPAGSLSFWQGWLYLGTFAICTILITLYLVKNDRRLLESRVQAGPVAETRKSQQIIQSFASLSFIALFILPGFDYRLHWSVVPPILSVIGAVIVAIGFYIVFLTFRENSFTSGTIEVAADQNVITTGPYALVRHPMYSGALLVVLLSPFVLGSWVAIPLPFPLIAVIIIRLLDEEKYLSANLKGYQEYCQKVHYHLIPGIW